jgi:hypothetical protein
VHADIGMYDAAAQEMARALELKSDLHTARFQLGLLNLTSGKVEEARSVWEGLDIPGDRDPLYLFKTGMLHIVERIRALPEEERTSPKAARIFVETVIAWEFGEQLLQDPQFTDLSKEVVNALLVFAPVYGVPSAGPYPKICTGGCVL